MKRWIYLTGAMFCMVLSVQAQQMKGILRSEQDTSVEYANFQLLELKDSSFVLGFISDKYGFFEFDLPDVRRFLLKISAVGYETYYLPIDGKVRNTNLGTISLKEDVTLLDSITITGNRIIQKIDRQIAFPNKLERESSNNGLELLQKMNLSRLKVDTQNRGISLVGNGSVQLRINGIPATVNDVYSIPAKDIIRVEYHDNPGTQYQEDAMLDFIVKRRQSGGYVSVDTKNSPHILHGDNMVTTKLNYKNSEWSAFYVLSYRDYKERWLDGEIKYKTPYEEFTKYQTGIPSGFYYQDHNVRLSYNYTIVDKRVFNVIFRGHFFHNFARDMDRSVYSNQPNLDFTNTDTYKNPAKSPSIDLYYKESISKTQDLYINLVGGYNYSNYTRNYQEKSGQGNIASYISDVTGKKYYLIAQGDHTKQWEKVFLYSGIKYNMGHTRNDYLGTINQNTSLDNGDLYAYTNLQGRIKKFAYSLGLGVSYSYFNDESQGFNFWTFRPAFSLSYSPIEQLQFRYIFNSKPNIPSLSQLSDVEQIVDQYQMMKGNPDLKPYRSYVNQLMISYQMPKWWINLGAFHSLYNKVIMQDIYWDNQWGKFVFTDNNQRHWQQATLYASVNYQIIPDMLSFNCYGQINWIDSKGSNYQHKYTAYYGSVQADFYLKGWSASAQIVSRYNSLWGESINYGEWPTFVLSAGYKYKKLYIGTTCWGLFTDKASYGYKNLSPIYNQECWTYIGDSSPIVSIQLKWEISWGKKSNAGKKIFDNSDSDNGILMVK